MSDAFTIFVSAVVILAAGYVYYRGRNSDLVYQKSTLDGKDYLVRNLPDKAEAANMLSRIRENLIVVYAHMKKKYPDEECVRLLSGRFDPNNIMETSQGEKYTSYTVNKGEKIILCIRARDGTNHLEQENTMMFVSLHEMAHIMTKTVGHEDDEFWSNFKFLLKQAIELGMYKPVDYRISPENYCGMQITDNPIHDQSIKMPVDE